jgi:serine/threonine protein kinase
MDSCYLIINGRYVLGKQLGSGSFGDIYMGVDKDEPEHSNKKLVAIKLEPRSKDVQLLSYEAGVYRYLYKEGKGIPNIYWSGIQDDYNVMVIEMLGPNLENLFNLCGRRLSLKTTIVLAQEIIKRIQYVHSKGVAHRDIKPENFLIGLNTNDVYIIDYGLCKLFKNNDRTHIPFSNKKKLVGTVRYASLNSHRGYELSRRDDLESIGYMLIYFLKGSLPWQGIGQKGMTRDEKYNLIYECKKNVSLEQLCAGLPIEFKLYMEHVRSLSFEEKPNYNYLYNLFTQLFKKKRYTYDQVYDWSRVKA